MEVEDGEEMEVEVVEEMEEAAAAEEEMEEAVEEEETEVEVEVAAAVARWPMKPSKFCYETGHVNANVFNKDPDALGPELFILVDNFGRTEE